MRKGRGASGGLCGLRAPLRVAALVALAARGAPARAQEPGAPRLEFSAPPDCLDEATFRNTLAVFFGGKDPFDPHAPDVVRVTFTRVKGGYRGTVQYTPAQGDPWPAEEKSGPLCELIAQSVARLASMRVPDPPPPPAPSGAAPAEPAPSRAAPAPPAPPPATKPADPVPSTRPEVFVPPPLPPRQSPPASNPPPPPPMDLTIALTASALMTAGFTADVGPAFQLGAEVRRDWFSLGLELRGVLPSKVFARERVDPTQLETRPQELDVSQVAAQLVPCIRFAKYFAGCGVVQGQIVLADDGRAPVSALTTVGLGPRFAVEVGFTDMLGAFAFGEALFAVPGTFVGYRDPAPGFETSPNVLWRQSVVSGFFGAGLLVKFE